MTARPSIDPAEFLHEHLEQASPDLLRELMEGFVNTLMSARLGSSSESGPVSATMLSRAAATAAGSRETVRSQNR